MMALRSARPMAPLAVLLLLMILQLAVHGHAIAPPPGTVKIVGFSYAGSGCPPRTAVGDVSDDGQVLTVMYSKYSASTDPPSSNRRRQCTVSVKLSYPAGFAFHLATVTMRGYANLDAGVVGTVQTSYYISGLQGTATCKHNLKGKVDNNFEITDAFLAAVFSKCNSIRNLQLISEVRVNPGSFKPARQGIVTMDSEDLKLTQICAIVWKKC